MGRYVTRMLEDEEIKSIMNCLKNGYTHNGHKHKPNKQIEMIIFMQTNLGCRIGDIVNMRVENIVKDGSTYKLDMSEQKTKKKRNFIVPTPIANRIIEYTEENNITSGRLFTIAEPAVWKSLRQITEYLGYENVSAHSFRKAAGMRVYMDSGKDIALTCQYYNHSNPTVTMRYLQRNSKQMDDVLSKSVFMV